MTIPISRRAFVRHATATLVTWRGAALLRLPAAERLRIGVARDVADSGMKSGVELGVELGVEEANHAAALFGGGVDITEVAADRPLPRALCAIIGGANEEVCSALSRRAEESRVLYLNAACSADSLRTTRCGAWSFHVAPSDAMLRDARAMAAAGGGQAVAVTAWDASLQRFGADTLNQRYAARFRRPMSADAWGAWLAVKVLWESSLRARSVKPSALRAYLMADATQFDGHKGRPLSFRPWDHQLRQPLYALPSTAELPPPSSGDEDTRAQLDRLGASAASAATTAACSSQR